MLFFKNLSKYQDLNRFIDARLSEIKNYKVSNLQNCYDNNNGILNFTFDQWSIPRKIEKWKKINGQFALGYWFDIECYED